LYQVVLLHTLLFFWIYITLEMKTDRVRTDITDITFIYIFLFGFDTLNRIQLNIDIINMQFKYSDKRYSIKC
jgi:hypothetical protein